MNALNFQEDMSVLGTDWIEHTDICMLVVLQFSLLDDVDNKHRYIKCLLRPTRFLCFIDIELYIRLAYDY